MIIFHDGYNTSIADRSNTVDAVAIVIYELRTQGFTFITVDQLLRTPDSSQ
jgi:hypothetical protein